MSVNIIWVGGGGPRGVGELPAGGIRASRHFFYFFVKIFILGSISNEFINFNLFPILIAELTALECLKNHY